MADEQEKGRGRGDGKLDYAEPVLVSLDERDKFSLGMCGVGVTGNNCGPGAAAAGICTSGGAAA